MALATEEHQAHICQTTMDVEVSVKINLNS